MVGSGGSFTALAHMSKWEREGRHGSVQGYLLTRADVVELLDNLVHACVDLLGVTAAYDPTAFGVPQITPLQATRIEGR